MSPIKSAQLQQLREKFATATDNVQRLAVIAETVAMLGLDYYAQDNAAKGFPCPLLRQCSVVLGSIY
jgi:hypothetical protein